MSHIPLVINSLPPARLISQLGIFVDTCYWILATHVIKYWWHTILNTCDTRYETHTTHFIKDLKYVTKDQRRTFNDLGLSLLKIYNASWERSTTYHTIVLWKNETFCFFFMLGVYSVRAIEAFVLIYLKYRCCRHI